jgi:hypothetical protein
VENTGENDRPAANSLTNFIKEFSVTEYGPLKGYHGYDPQYSDMRGIFVATGPGNYYILHRCISCSENNHHIAIFIPQSLYQLYRGGQFYWWRTPEKTTDLPQIH